MTCPVMTTTDIIQIASGYSMRRRKTCTLTMTCNIIKTIKKQPQSGRKITEKQQSSGSCTIFEAYFSKRCCTVLKSSRFSRKRSENFSKVVPFCSNIIEKSLFQAKKRGLPAANLSFLTFSSCSCQTQCVFSEKTAPQGMFD